MIMKKLILLAALFFLFNSCTDCDDDFVNVSNCNQTAQIIEEEPFNAIETYNYQISDIVLNQDCLEITIYSSGCNPDNWAMNLFCSNILYDVLPMQRYAKIELINNEACLAIFPKTISFDLTNYQIWGQSEVPITLEGWSEQIIYAY